MRYLFFTGLILGANFLKAQVHPTAVPNLEAREISAKTQGLPQGPSGTLIWSEDFSNGIPNTWSQNASPSAALWQYRGPNTSPNNLMGSRGAYSGKDFSPPTNLPIASPSAANGFIIFDSDWLDNAGLSNNHGNGSAPVPHTGGLITDTINLLHQNDVELKFNTYARRYSAAWKVALSIDGGASFPDTLEFFPPIKNGSNTPTSRDAVARADISAIAGGQEHVVLQFIFESSPTNMLSSGYYFWMIDDIEIRSLPANYLQFTEIIMPNGDTAAPLDQIYDANEDYPKYGIMHSNQIVPIEFNANIYNYGLNPQTNLKLEVEIWDVTNGGANLITALSTPGCLTLASGDTCDLFNLTTPAWTPPAIEAEYLIVYKAVSDYFSSSTTYLTDTFSFAVDDHAYSLGRQNLDNYIGTNSSAQDVVSVGVLLNLSNPDPLNPGSGLVYLDGFNLQLSPLIDTTADIRIVFRDSSAGGGLFYTYGFIPAAGPIYVKQFSLDSSHAGANAFFDLSLNNGQPLGLPVGFYYVYVEFYPNAPDGIIRIGNDASLIQPFESSYIQLGNGEWYPGFNNREMQSPHFGLSLTQYIGLNETEISSFKLFPNPITDRGNLELTNGGVYEITVYDMLGKPVYELQTQVNSQERININFSQYPKGLYLVNVVGEGSDETLKVLVQ